MSTSELRLASRASELAMAQTRLVARLLEERHEGLRTVIVEVRSRGDRDLSTPIDRLTEVGAFVRSLQEAVLEGRADAAVHSCKDLPTSGPEGLVAAAYPERASPLDALVGPSLGELEPGARVGTGSPRRIAQLRLLRPDLEPVGLRGNVPTRLGKVAEGQVDAAVLAVAGLERLGLDGRIGERFGLEEMVPAPAQGVLAVETRTDGAAWELVSAIDAPEVRRAVEVERRLLGETGAGCRAALGALAEEEGSTMRMTAFVEDERGGRRAVIEDADPDEVVRRVREELGL